MRWFRARKAVIGILAAALVTAAAGLLLFRVNRFSLSLELTGDPELTWEYGNPYEEPGVVPRVSGSLLFRNGWVPDVEISSMDTVDETKLGLQTITYRAEYHGMVASATRTVRVVDTQAPVITLHTKPGYTPTSDAPYEEEGYTAWDNRDGDITHRVIRQEQFGFVTYTVLDSSGNPGSAVREIPEYDFTVPELTLLGGTEMTIYAGTRFEDPGAAALDNVDGDISEHILVEGEVTWYKKGSYPLIYSVTDSFGNTSQLQRTVHVVARPRSETVDPGNKVIYLTFDDGPGPYTPALLKVLDSYDVRATFFVVDTGYYDVMRQIVGAGHSIGIHTMTHNYRQIYESEEAYFADILGMQQLIEEQTGVKTWLMRFPGGSSNAVSRFNKGIMTRLTQAVQDAGFHYFDWNVDSDDAGSARSPKTVLKNVVTGVMENNVSVVLQHDIHGYSVEAVENILVWGYENGYTFLPLEPDSPTMHHGLNN